MSSLRSAARSLSAVPSLAWLVAAGAGALAGCEIEQEEAYVDHDIGVLREGLAVGDATGCSTAIVAGLTAQLVEELNCLAPDSMVNFSGPHVELSAAVQPYLAPEAAAALLRATTAADDVIGITSAYRSVAQQYLLRQWWLTNQCGIAAAAIPGESNHQSGRALDVPKYSKWGDWLVPDGYTWFGKADKVHFDFFAAPDFGHQSVLAFERLWNRNNPDQLAEDSLWDDADDAAMARSPAEGFAVHGCTP
jgi:hypothetical protein